MPYLIGTDEAGYGPNLGPLVVAATVWQVPPDCDGEQLYERLAGTVSAEKPTADDARLWMADSKTLYSRSTGLGTLELGALAALTAHSRQLLTRWQQVWDRLDPAGGQQMREVAWYRDYDCVLPIDCPCGEVLAAAARLRAALRECNVELINIGSKVLTARTFNALVDNLGNKSHVLSWATVQLVSELLERLLGDDSVLVLCDKHGGRSRYQRVLQLQFPETLVEVFRETRAQSVYRMGRPPARVEFRFSVGGESALPTALASMIAKYQRELAMRAFNAFWQSHDEGLKPSAGYPVDARRFAKDIAPLKKQLQISDEALWRQC